MQEFIILNHNPTLPLPLTLTPHPYQEFMILPIGAKDFTEAMKMGSEVYHHLKSVTLTLPLTLPLPLPLTRSTTTSTAARASPSSGVERAPSPTTPSPTSARTTRRAIQLQPSP